MPVGLLLIFIMCITHVLKCAFQSPQNVCNGSPPAPLARVQYGIVCVSFVGDPPTEGVLLMKQSEDPGATMLLLYHDCLDN